MSSSKQKKPYLKRGSRQFLSNAQVRSQSSKPKIVDFGADQQQYTGTSALQIRSSQNVNPNTDDIKIKAGPVSAKNIPAHTSTHVGGKGSAFAGNNEQPIKRNQRPPIMARNVDTSAGKTSAAKRDTSLGKKKKQVTLDDYLDSQSHGPDQYMATTTKKVNAGVISANAKNVLQKSSYKKDQYKNNNNSSEEDRGSYKNSKQHNNYNNIKSRHTELVQQQYQDDDEEQSPNLMQNDSFKPIKNPIVKNKESTLPATPQIARNSASFHNNNNDQAVPKNIPSSSSIAKKQSTPAPQNPHSHQHHGNNKYSNYDDEDVDVDMGHDEQQKQLQVAHHQYCNQVNFISDKSQDQNQRQQQLPRFNNKNNTNNNKIHHKQPQQQQQYRRQQYHQQQQQQVNNNNNAPVVSKVKMNYFNKNNNIKNSDARQQNDSNTIPLSHYNRKQQAGSASMSTHNNSNNINSSNSISINQIPAHIKQQIVKQTIAQKQQQLTNQLQKLKDKFQLIKKQKQKLQQEHKNIKKQKADFEKQMEQKNKQFQQKIKNQNNKLMRQKKYMKDAQMSGQGDRKYKNQLEEVRKLLDKEKQQKKKMQSKYKIQIQNLRKKLSEQASKNKLLSQQIKLLQYGQILHKQQLQDMSKQQKKNTVQVHKIGMWADVPQSTFISRFFDQDFSLIELDLNKFQYDENEYYNYYLKVKDHESMLQSQKSDQDRIKRFYKNGKVQLEHIKKFIKQVFPFNYTIVHMWNGDVKQLLPQGVLIYFSQNSQITQYTVKTQQAQKQIVHFPKNQTVQMRVIKLSNNNNNNNEGNYTEVYCSGHLKRTFDNGAVVFLKRDSIGKIIEMPYNA